MATLTQTAFYTRRTVNYIILGIISYILLRIFWSIFIVVFFAIFPPKAPPPNHAFGKLPAVKFPAPIASPSAALTFRLETIEGSVPKASESAAVYFMPKTPANLLALSKTQEFARKLQFDPSPVQESKNIYRFNDPELPLRKLRYDIVSNNFIVRYGFEQDTSLFLERNLPATEVAIAEARGMLQTYDLYASDIAGGETGVSFLKLSGNALVPTTSLSNADAVRVDFYRKNIGTTRAVGPYVKEAPISIVFSGSKYPKKHVIQFAYTYWPVDYQTVGTYALRPASQAWQDLQSNMGYIVAYPASGSTITVRQIYLAYYDSFDPQTYLQPVFVFEGDEGFLGLVPAVTSAWTE